MTRQLHVRKISHLPPLKFGARRRRASGLPALLLAGLSLRRQGWRWQSGKLSMLGMFAPRWVAAKVDGGPKRAMNAAYGPTDVAGEPEQPGRETQDPRSGT
jgi:hypothetical protein